MKKYHTFIHREKKKNKVPGFGSATNIKNGWSLFDAYVWLFFSSSTPYAKNETYSKYWILYTTVKLLNKRDISCKRESNR